MDIVRNMAVIMRYCEQHRWKWPYQIGLWARDSIFGVAQDIPTLEGLLGIIDGELLLRRPVIVVTDPVSKQKRCDANE